MSYFPSQTAFPIPRLDEISHVREEEPLVPDILEPQEPEILSFTYTGEERQRGSSSLELVVLSVSAPLSPWGTALIGSCGSPGSTTVCL